MPLASLTDKTVLESEFTEFFSCNSDIDLQNVGAMNNRHAERNQYDLELQTMV